MKNIYELLKDYNRHARTFGYAEKTLEEFRVYKSGKAKLTNRKNKAGLDTRTMIRKSPVVESGTPVSYHPQHVKENMYTGDRLIGIATLHKSNMVPVFHKQDAEDISKMRRG